MGVEKSASPALIDAHLATWGNKNYLMTKNTFLVRKSRGKKESSAKESKNAKSALKS